MTEPTGGAPKASRGPPARVPPITIDGITYRGVAGIAAQDGQAGGWLGAYGADGSLLWTQKIYENVRRPDIEGDVQDVFFQAMTLEADGTIRIVNERGKRFRFDPRTRAVTEMPSPVPSPDSGAAPPPPPRREE
ncbi:MAG: hypothetical protein ACOYO0_12180 [Sandarakinorhabdus sp.]